MAGSVVLAPDTLGVLRVFGSAFTVRIASVSVSAATDVQILAGKVFASPIAPLRPPVGPRRLFERSGGMGSDGNEYHSNAFPFLRALSELFRATELGDGTLPEYIKNPVVYNPDAEVDLQCPTPQPEPPGPNDGPGTQPMAQ